MKHEELADLIIAIIKQLREEHQALATRVEKIEYEYQNLQRRTTPNPMQKKRRTKKE